MSGRRRLGRIRTHPARQARIARKHSSAAGQPDGGHAVAAAVPRLPRSWLESAWSGGAPFKAMRRQHRQEREKREREREGGGR